MYNFATPGLANLHFPRAELLQGQTWAGACLSALQDVPCSLHMASARSEQCACSRQHVSRSGYPHNLCPTAICLQTNSQLKLPSQSCENEMPACTLF